MEMDDNNSLSEQGDYVEIYSKKVIFWFAVISPLYAAILLMINLWVAGFKSAIYQVILFIILWAAATLLAENKFAKFLNITDLLKDPRSMYVNIVSLVMNIGCGLILTRYFFKRYFPDDDYYPRNIQTPLFIFIGFILFALLVLGRSL